MTNEMINKEEFNNRYEVSKRLKNVQSYKKIIKNFFETGVKPNNISVGIRLEGKEKTFIFDLNLKEKSTFKV